MSDDFEVNAIGTADKLARYEEALIDIQVWAQDYAYDRDNPDPDGAKFENDYGFPYSVTVEALKE